MIPLIVDLELDWRGGQNQAFLLLKGLHARGHAAELVASEDSALAERARAIGVKVHSVPARLSVLKASWTLYQLFGERIPEVVHANEPRALTAAWLARTHTRTPLVVSRRVGYPLTRGWPAKARYRAARRIVANSQWVADNVAACGIPRKKITVVHEGVEIPRLPTPRERRLARSRWGVEESAPLLGCTGVFLPDKGQEWLIRALAALQPEFPTSRLLLAGDGPLRPQLESLAGQLGVSAAVFFPGFVKDIDSVYAALDIFLLPSFFEALNNSLLAAMTYEVPCIAFSKGALPEIVEHERSGLLVSGPDVGEIHSAMARLLNNPDFARILGCRARKRVEENFSADRMVDGTIAVYQDVLHQEGPA